MMEEIIKSKEKSFTKEIELAVYSLGDLQDKIEEMGDQKTKKELLDFVDKRCVQLNLAERFESGKGDKILLGDYKALIFDLEEKLREIETESVDNSALEPKAEKSKNINFEKFKSAYAEAYQKNRFSADRKFWMNVRSYTEATGKASVKTGPEGNMDYSRHYSLAELDELLKKYPNVDEPAKKTEANAEKGKTAEDVKMQIDSLKDRIIERISGVKEVGAPLSAFLIDIDEIESGSLSKEEKKEALAYHKKANEELREVVSKKMKELEKDMEEKAEEENIKVADVDFEAIIGKEIVGKIVERIKIFKEGLEDDLLSDESWQKYKEETKEDILNVAISEAIEKMLEKVVAKKGIGVEINKEDFVKYITGKI